MMARALAEERLDYHREGWCVAAARVTIRDMTSEPDLSTMTAPAAIGRWHGLVLDSGDPAVLATFYQQLLGMIRVQDEAGWVVIGDAPDRPGLAFTRISGYQPQQWPDHPAHLHLDVRVDDLDIAQAAVLAAGATKLDGGDSGVFRVFADPAGHPFCLVTM
jgi:catechol 2,3-dioxygenase-like lactoylglutathione lyase family enzyme